MSFQKETPDQRRAREAAEDVEQQEQHSPPPKKRPGPKPRVLPQEVPAMQLNEVDRVGAPVKTEYTKWSDADIEYVIKVL